MQPAPGPADYKLLKESAVAALQILYLEVVSLGSLVGKSEANKRLSIEIGESCCNQLLLIHCCKHDFSLQQRCLGKLCNLKLHPVASSHPCLSAHFPNHSSMQFVKSSSCYTLNSQSCPIETLLCQIRQGLDPVTSCDGRSQVQNVLIKHVMSGFASFYLTKNSTET